jgi:hypothetical protein
MNFPFKNGKNIGTSYVPGGIKSLLMIMLFEAMQTIHGN